MGDGISVPRFPRFSQNGPLTMYTFDTTVQYGTAVNQVRTAVQRKEQQKYMCCTVQHCILWMLHCKKSPSPVTHSKTHVFCAEGEETGSAGIFIYSYRSVPSAFVVAFYTPKKSLEHTMCTQMHYIYWEQTIEW